MAAAELVAWITSPTGSAIDNAINQPFVELFGGPPPRLPITIAKFFRVDGNRPA